MAPTPKPLTDFLLSLATDDALASYNQRSRASADAFLEERGLNEAQRAAVLSRDVSAIAYQLSLEGAANEFYVPGGPTMDPPVRFRAVLEGTMDPGPFPPTMDPLAATSTKKTAAGPFPPTMDPLSATSTRLATSRRKSAKRKGTAKKSRAAAKSSRKTASKAKAKKAGGKRKK